MGHIYRAERVQLGRPVAIKILQAPLANQQKFLQRFEREAHALSRLGHPNCVSIIDFGVADAPYLVMDFVHGKSLKEVLEKGPLRPARAVHIFRQVIAALAHAHGCGIIHRDVKPGNIMLTEATGVGDHIRILDFGLSKLRTAPLGADMTGSIKVIGTPAYMSPEQASGREVDVRSDLYSAGAVLFEMLSGKKPFDATNMLDVLRMHKERPPPYLREHCTTTKFSAEIEAVIIKAMAKKPKERFQSALEFSAALDGTPEASMPLLRMYGSAKKEPTTSRSTEIPAKRVLQPRPERSRIWLWILLLALVAGAGTWLHWGGGMAFLLSRFEIFGAGKPGEERTATPSVVAAKPTKPAKPVAVRPLVADAGAALDSEDPDSKPPDSKAADSEPLAENGASEDESEDVDGDDVDGDDVSTGKEEQASMKEVSRRASKETTTERREEAIARYIKLHRKKPKNAYYAYVLGKLYFDKRWWGEGMKYYSSAMNNDRNCRKWRRINQDLITALASSKTGAKAAYIIVNQIGRPALPYLERAAKRHKFNSVRQRAQKLIKRIRAGR